MAGIAVAMSVCLYLIAVAIECSCRNDLYLLPSFGPVVRGVTDAEQVEPINRLRHSSRVLSPCPHLSGGIKQGNGSADSIVRLNRELRFKEWT